MAKNVIELYYDCVSPYSWIAFEALNRYVQIMPFELKLKPFLIGGVMRHAGNTPPALVCPQKAVYMTAELPILAKYWNIPLNQPENFVSGAMKHGTMKAQRFLTAIQLNSPQYLVPASRELFARVWSTDQPVHEVAHLREVAAKIGLPTAENIIGAIESPRVKDTLKARTQSAIELGAFGAPWIVVKRPGEADICLFGSDRMHVIADLLGAPFPGPAVQSKL